MIYIDMLRHWARMIGGTSYWHQPQGMGRAFRAGILAGYFNDLTSKANWLGDGDDDGNPFLVVGGRKVYWPTTVLQRGLAHWDLWLISGYKNDENRAAFLGAANWAVSKQDAHGGWPHPVPLHPQALSDYSSMSQGQGASLLVRAYTAFHRPEYLSAAKKAIEIMLVPVEHGGTAVKEGDGIVLEEFPSAERNTVLNGWIFAIFGLHDYILVDPIAEFALALDSTLGKLACSLSEFDLGYWSGYAMGGAVASPFYHDLHIAQLEALCLAFPQYQPAFNAFRYGLERQRSRRINKYRAMARKAGQKLLHPPHVMATNSSAT